MTPRRIDADMLAVRVRLIRELLDELSGLEGATDPQRLDTEPVTRAAAERFIQSIVDLALDVNGHITAAQLEVAPASGRSSFELMAEAGVLDAELAKAMAPSVSLRNLLVRRYAAIDVEKVAEAVDPIVEQYRQYVHRVAAFVKEAMNDREP